MEPMAVLAEEDLTESMVALEYLVKEILGAEEDSPEMAVAAAVQMPQEDRHIKVIILMVALVNILVNGQMQDHLLAILVAAVVVVTNTTPADQMAVEAQVQEAELQIQAVGAEVVDLAAAHQEVAALVL